MRALFLVLPLLAGCASSKTSGPVAATCQRVESGFGPDGTIAVKAETVVSGLEVPWGLAFLPGGDLLVTERPGRLRLVRNGQVVAQPVATFQVGGGSEAGLLGLATHPEFPQNSLFFVYLTVADGSAVQNRIDQYKLAADHLSATFERTIFGSIPGAEFHDGGRLRFGPDGKLYVGTGDGRSPNRSQDPNTPSGKLLRLNANGTVPQDNPVAGNPLFLLGVRNVQGFDWKDATTLYVTDHGPSGELNRSGNDEVTVARAGQNLGWPTIFGCEAQDGLVSPALVFPKAVPPGGAAIYTGTSIAGWKGSLLIGSLGSKHLHRVVFDASDAVSAHEVYFEDAFGRLREVLMGPDGHLYVTTSNCDGRGNCGAEKDRILRIVGG